MVKCEINHYAWDLFTLLSMQHKNSLIKVFIILNFVMSFVTYICRFLLFFLFCCIRFELQDLMGKVFNGVFGGFSRRARPTMDRWPLNGPCKNYDNGKWDLLNMRIATCFTHFSTQNDKPYSNARILSALIRFKLLPPKLTS